MSDVTVTMSAEAKSYLLDRAREWFAPEADEIVTALRNAKPAGERYEPVEDGDIPLLGGMDTLKIRSGIVVIEATDDPSIWRTLNLPKDYVIARKVGA